MATGNKPNITIFYCVNSFNQSTIPVFKDCKVKFIKMPCSSMTKDVYLLRAFEAGADAVLVLACPEDMCRYVEGGARARKRIKWVRGILEGIGMDGKRQLSIYNIAAKDGIAVKDIIKKTLKGLKETGAKKNDNR